MSIQTTNPATNKVIKSFDEMTDKQVEDAIALSNTTFKDWKKTSYKDRATILHKVAKLMRAKKTELATLITLEMGKVFAQSEGEIDLSASILDYYADNAETFLADKKLSPEQGEAFVRSSPIGVLFGVMPWNFPFYQVVRFAAPNIMVGNTILLKHASIVPQCAIAIDELFKEAGAPEGLYTNLMISGKRSTALVEDVRIKGISLTGSEGAGASMAEAAGKNLKRSVLELGGSDAFIILADADIDKTVDLAIFGRMNNNGQSCVASKRFIAVEAIADEFLEKFTAKVAALKVGDPMDPSTDVGPLSSEEALQGLLEQVKKFEAAGATVVVGGKRASKEGAYMQPTLLTNLKRGEPTFYEELFGPVASFYKVKDEQEAIDLANDSPFGLGGSIYTKDIKNAIKIADQIDSGMVFINSPTWTQADLPFGGTKRSGYGRELSEQGIQEFVNKKLIRVS
ncbi:succinate-semialdehyde dehydrogenase/glutarate-semialdehyde dehydrogenase [Flavobacterium sp. 7E]|uniref:NAD-dependent succinate-semialdehyde dehydrogenase n=1 Tax=unclassified Flavobacterium TaxID=196869 RepID=UPI00156E283E|nr:MULTISPECIES: NAD-dependent succinate-semialdehyde dehydrogenase [unclassified Flavobacterium]MBE0393327.1 Succinate-semialdehyde dehydrogenase [NADP(+)] 1 [Flavobacterium sp. PL002]NRS90267.1 succinate-semialdehyde dehydrogenase/glutarate-semialdehyde dehydrogenase [Flavobacterium sp. 7E]